MKSFKIYFTGLAILLTIGYFNLLSASTTQKEKPITEETKRPSVDISGSGIVNAGTYGEIHISGSGQLLGVIKTNVLEVSGQASSNGSITADTLDASGSFSGMDDLTVKNL